MELVSLGCCFSRFGGGPAGRGGGPAGRGGATVLATTLLLPLEPLVVHTY